MKKIIFISFFMISLLSACENFDIDHPDFEYTSGYFPYQFPVRTLILGDYIYDNSNDNAQKFLISIGIGGVYENQKDRVFQIQVDNTLSHNILFSEGGDPIKSLPDDYYKLSANEIIVPKGKVNGGVEIQLTDAFFNDPDAIKNTYVVPLWIVESKDVDTILVGQSTNPHADPRIASQWDIAPKDFTMFAVKYINEFHGTYFRYGSSSVKDVSGNIIESTAYNTQDYVENNPTVKLFTEGRHQVSLNSFFQSEIMESTFDLILTFEGDNCSVSAPADSPYLISGTGKFHEKEYSWGNKGRNGITLNYSIFDGVHTYEATDVLVIRDRDVVMEVFSPVLL